MQETGSVKVRKLYDRLNLIEGLSKKWSLRLAKELLTEISEALPLLKAKDQREVRKLFQHCAATLSGVINGRKDQLIERVEAKAYLKKLIPVVTTLQEKIRELDILDDIDSPPIKKKPITIRPGIDEVGQEAQKRIKEVVTGEDGLVRTSQSEEESTVPEKQWEESEYYRILKEQGLHTWNENFYGEIGEAFSKYAPQIQALKTVIKGQAILQVAPIVPTARAEAIFRVETLAQSGVKVITIAGSPVFEDQLLLTVNTNLVADTNVETAEYKMKCREYKKKIEGYANKFGGILMLEKQIKDIREELSHFEVTTIEDAIGKDGKDNMKEAKATRAKRILYNEQKIKTAEAQIRLLKVKFTKEYEEFAILSDEYKEYASEGRSKFRGKMGEYSDKSLELARSCLTSINSRLNKDQQLVLVSEQGLAHGYVTCYWVMRDSQFGAWSGAICFSKLKLQILDWCFPKPSQHNRKNTLDREIATHSLMINFIHMLYRKEEAYKEVEKKVEKFLDLRRIKYEGKVRESVKKIWEESEEVLSELDGTKVRIELLASLKKVSILDKLRR